jgi:hypothetical protein
MTTPTFKYRCPCAFPHYWTPEQALAVAEFLSDLREAIWAHYGDELREAYRNLHAPIPRTNRSDAPDDTSS